MSVYNIALQLLDNKQRISGNKIKSHPELVNKIKHYYSDSYSIQETIYRIIHHIDIRPTCLNCGNPVQFLGKIKIPFRQYCCYVCSRKSSIMKEKTKNTSIQRYGGIGFAVKKLKDKAEKKSIELYGENYRSTVQQVKAKQTKLERYGNPNYNNRKKAALHTNRKKVYESYKKTMNLKYGVDNYFQTLDCRKKCLSLESLLKSQNTRIQNGTLRKSYIEIKVYEYIKTISKLDIETNTRKYLDGMEIDIFIPALNYGIEVQGDFFHKNPRFYKDPDELANLPRRKKGTNNLTVGDIWACDSRKLQLAKQKGIKLVQIWEYDIKNNWSEVQKQIAEQLTMLRCK